MSRRRKTTQNYLHQVPPSFCRFPLLLLQARLSPLMRSLPCRGQVHTGCSVCWSTGSASLQDIALRRCNNASRLCCEKRPGPLQNEVQCRTGLSLQKSTGCEEHFTQKATCLREALQSNIPACHGHEIVPTNKWEKQDMKTDKRRLFRKSPRVQRRLTSV